MSAGAILSGDQWKDPNLVARWKAERRQHLETRWKKKAQKTDTEWRREYSPLLSGVPLLVAPDPARKLELAGAAELIQWENESLNHRARRLEGEDGSQVAHADGRTVFAPPMLMANDRGSWILTPAAVHAKPEKLAKSERMYKKGLEKKANRELACGLLGWVVPCENGHTFRVPYQCGNRYCVTCGPKGALRLFARHFPRILFTATRLMMCRSSDCWGNVCDECSKAIEEKRIPHWPPPRGQKPRKVLAKIDFTLKNTGRTPGPAMMRELNDYIKKFCRLLERRFHISRKEYGIIYCDELGGNNTNAHAHALYAGPWLPQEHKELSKLWEQVTGGSFIISIKYAKSIEEALFHAIKYPAKFAERSTPERLADLEVIFHRVRRFHALAAFYAPEVPEEEEDPNEGSRHCPICDAPLLRRGEWQTLYDLDRRGLKDVTAVEKEIARSRGLTGPGPP